MSTIPTTIDQRLRVGATGTLRFHLLDGDGAAVAATGTLTVDLARDSGASIATGRTTSDGEGLGRYTATISPAEATLDIIVATWKDGTTVVGTTTIEVSDHLVSLTDIRNHDSAFGDDQRYSNEDLINLRLGVEQECEEICERAFRPRPSRETLSGRGERWLQVEHNDVRGIVSVAIDGTEFTTEQLNALDVDGRRIYRADGDVWDWGTNNIVVQYTHGWDAPPQRLQDALIARMASTRSHKNPGLMDRTSRFTNAQGESHDLNRESRDSTGVDWIDGVYQRYAVSSTAGGEGGDNGPGPAYGSIQYDPAADSIYHAGNR